MPNFWPVGITPSCSFVARGKVFHFRHSTVLPRPLGRYCFLPNWLNTILHRAFSSNSVS